MPVEALLNAPGAAAMVGSVPRASVEFQRPMTGRVLAEVAEDCSSSAVTSRVRVRLAWTENVDQEVYP